MPEWKRRYKTILFHVVAWLILSVLQSLSVLSYGNAPFLPKLLSEMIWTIPNLPFAYVVAYIFIPRLLLKNRLAIFLLVVILWNICWMPLNSLFYSYVIGPWQYGKVIPFSSFGGLFNLSELIPMSIPVCVFSVISLVGNYIKENEKVVQFEKERLSFELQLLRSQLHPQFLLETLDGLRLHLLQSWETSSEVIISLSHLLRYTLYECDVPKVLLKKDMEALVHYIRLEKFRYDNLIDVSISITGETGEMMVEPLLLFALMENAFSQVAADKAEQAWISLDIRIEGMLLKVKLINSRVHEIGEEAIELLQLPLSCNNKKITLSYGTAMPVGG